MAPQTLVEQGENNDYSRNYKIPKLRFLNWVPNSLAWLWWSSKNLPGIGERRGNFLRALQVWDCCLELCEAQGELAVQSWKGLGVCLLRAYVAREFLNFLPACWALLPAPPIPRSWLSSTQFWLSKCTCLDQTTAHPLPTPPPHQAGEESIFNLPGAMETPNGPPLGLKQPALRNRLGHRANLFHPKQEAATWFLTTASAIHVIKIIP